MFCMSAKKSSFGFSDQSPFIHMFAVYPTWLVGDFTGFLMAFSFQLLYRSQNCGVHQPGNRCSFCRATKALLTASLIKASLRKWCRLFCSLHTHCEHTLKLVAGKWKSGKCCFKIVVRMIWFLCSVLSKLQTMTCISAVCIRNLHLIWILQFLCSFFLRKKDLKAVRFSLISKWKSNSSQKEMGANKTQQNRQNLPGCIMSANKVAYCKMAIW